MANAARQAVTRMGVQPQEVGGVCLGVFMAC